MTTTEAPTTEQHPEDAEHERLLDEVLAEIRQKIADEIADLDELYATMARNAVAGSYMTPEKAAELREPFPPEAVGKLPRISCRACSDAQSRVCNEHSKRECETCGNFMTVRHVHLDYVGHAAATARLLHVDPLWSWEPFAIDPAGLPMIQRGDKHNRLWIRLTVCGVTRIGVGIAESWKPEGDKELIGDAIRNAAMRFGVALDLWSKEDLSAMAHDEVTGPTAQQRASAAAEAAPPAPPTTTTTTAASTGEQITPEHAAAIKGISARLDTLGPEVAAAFKAWKDDQGFPWPWPMAACTVMGRKMDELVAEHGGQAPGTPDPGAGTPPATEAADGDPGAAAPPSTGEGLPPATDLPENGPCELCGSTRAQQAIVNGVRRCRNANDCKKRQEAREEAEREGVTTPLPEGASAVHDPGGDPPLPDTDRQHGSDGGAEPTDHGTAEAEAAAAREHAEETGDEMLYCSAENCGTPIVGELPVFGDSEEPYHVGCAPAFQGS